MKISIITTIYKAEKDLPRLLDSMMAQKSANLEFFLINNGSPDKCGKICDEYAKKDSRFKVLTLKDNIGYIEARNVGIQRVDADYVGFCDSDDFLEPGGYDNAVEKLMSTDCDLYITAYRTISENATTVNYIPYSVGLYAGEQVLHDILPQAFGNFPQKPALHGFAWKQIFRRSIFIENQLYYIKNLQPYEDQILNIDFIKNSKKVYIDNNIIYNYIVNEESITVKLMHNFNLNEEWQRIMLFYFEKKNRITEKCREEALSNQMLTFLYTMLLNSAKRSDISINRLTRELKQCCDKKVIKQMTRNASVQCDFRMRVIKKCLLNSKFRILISLLRLGLKLRR